MSISNDVSGLVRQCGEAGSFMLPFFYFAENTEPRKIPTGPEFNRHWKVVERASGRYVDESGRRVAVRRRDDSETDVDDVYWAAHQLAKFWSGYVEGHNVASKLCDARRPAGICVVGSAFSRG